VKKDIPGRPRAGTITTKEGKFTYQMNSESELYRLQGKGPKVKQVSSGRGRRLKRGLAPDNPNPRLCKLNQRNKPVSCGRGGPVWKNCPARRGEGMEMAFFWKLRGRESGRKFGGD